MNPKPFYLSKTFWLNTVTLSISVIGAITGYVPPEAQPYLAATLAVLNVVLRALSPDQPLTLK